MQQKYIITKLTPFYLRFTHLGGSAGSGSGRGKHNSLALQKIRFSYNYKITPRYNQRRLFISLQKSNSTKEMPTNSLSNINLEKKFKDTKENFESIKKLTETIVNNPTDSQAAKDAAIKLGEQAVQGSENTSAMLSAIEEFKPDGSVTKASILDLSVVNNYLDSLTLNQESALYHILVFFLIIIIIFNIIAILFGNQIITYFNLENRYPSLQPFLKLRGKIQRYSLFWNFLILFTVCVVSIYFNILLFSLG